MSNMQPSSSAPGIAHDMYGQKPVDVGSTFPADTKDAEASISDRGSDDVPDDRAQHGVKMVEAVTLAWTKKTLGTAYIL